MRDFAATLNMARQGDREVIEQLLLLYEPLIERCSRIDGKVDEDLRQFINLRFLISLKNFSKQSTFLNSQTPL